MTASRGDRTHRTWRAALDDRRAVALVVVLVLAIDALAVLSILATRRQARAAAATELSRQVASHARAMEALLATLRADLAFLATSPRLGTEIGRVSDDDPLSRRWARLEAESTLLLFAGGHPGVASLAVASAAGDDVATVARRLEPGRVSDPFVVPAAPAPPELALRLEFPVEGGGVLRSVVDPALLLATMLRGAEEEAASGLALRLRGDDPGEPVAEAELVRAGVDVHGWEAPGGLFLERPLREGPLLAAVERLELRWRLTVLLNLLVITLGLPLAILAVRTARRAAALEAQRQHAEERRRLERGLWQQERLATVGRMASGIAHEINNPLAGLTNHLSLLDEELAAGDLAAARRRTPRIGQGAERIREIVRRALGLATPATGRRDVVDLAELLSETIALVAGEDAAGGSPAVRLEVAGDDAPGSLAARGDRAALAQLFTNLMLNALQLSGRDDDGAAPDAVTVRLLAEGSSCVVRIEDRGPGIDPEIADRLFEPFVSGRGSTGLGLAVSLGIAREHGGTLTAENRAGGGARFELRLPRTAGDAGDAERIPPLRSVRREIS